MTSFAAGSAHSTYLWVNLFGTKAGDRIDFKWFTPNGTQYASWYWNVPEIHYGWWIAGTDIPSNAPTGQWKIDFSIEGNLVATTGFAVAVPEPETYAMMLLGLGVLGWAGKRRKAA